MADKTSPRRVSPEPAIYWTLGIGPVQSFIAEARRSRDLRAGSRLLAWLTGSLLARLVSDGAVLLLPRLAPKGQEEEQNAILQDLRDNPERALVEPKTKEGKESEDEQKRLPPIPNRASGTIPGSLENARAKLENLESTLEDEWSRLLAYVRKDAARSASGVWNELSRFLGETACPLQLTWVLCEAPASAAEGLAQVDALFAAAKRSRPIGEYRGGAPVRKCGLCGRREALGGSTPSELRAFYEEKLGKHDEIESGLRFSKDEHLCPICVWRRFAGYVSKEPFPSTSEIASSVWHWQLRRAGFGPNLEAIELATRQVPGFEPGWADRAPLYYETTARRDLKHARQGGKVRKAEALAHVLGEQKKLAAAFEKSKTEIHAQPPGYLAVLMFDGDDMGGRMRKDLDTLPDKLLKFQKELLNTLKVEAGDAPPFGRDFYLGGDEGLILVPTSRALDLAAEICRLWSEIIDSESSPPRPTMSMSLTFFGRERPLGFALESAHHALEHTAKRYRGNGSKKGALAVAIQTASGNVWRTVAPWGESWKRIRDAVDMIRSGELAAGWPHDVEAFLRTLPKVAYQRGENARAAIRAEVERVTRRRILEKPAELSLEARHARAWKRLEGGSWWQRQPTLEEIEALPEQLHLISFLARQVDAASPWPREGSQSRGG